MMHQQRSEEKLKILVRTFEHMMKNIGAKDEGSPRPLAAQQQCPSGWQTLLTLNFYVLYKIDELAIVREGRPKGVARHVREFVLSFHVYINDTRTGEKCGFKKRFP
jgi:hypothetical protein